MKLQLNPRRSSFLRGILSEGLKTPLWKREVGEILFSEVLGQDTSFLGRFIRSERWHELCVRELVGAAINKGG